MSIDDDVVVPAPVGVDPGVEPAPPPSEVRAARPTPDRTRVRRPTDARSLLGTVARWLLGTVVGIIIVLYALSPLFQQRDQHKLLTSYRTALRQSSLQSTGLFGLTLPNEPPGTGAAVGILDIGRLHLQQVVTEGVGPAQTERAPGHVPGTAGLGQPGNSAVVGRRSAFGGVFSGLHSLRPGDAIVATTIEGQSLYVVTQVRTVTLTNGTAAPGLSAVPGAQTSTVATAPGRIGSSVGVDDLYGSSATNRLTLVTSDSDLPWNTSKATVVIATMKTAPFTPTPQQARSASQDGRSGASGTLAPLVLALEAFVLVAIGAVVLYRRAPIRTAYLVSTAPLVVATILLAVAVSHMLPAWA